MPVLENYEPRAVLRFFEEICSIPHGSGNTGKISDYLVRFARERQLDFRKENCNNVIIRKPASPGYEYAPTVILQGHMDMVTVKTGDCLKDLSREGLDLQVVQMPGANPTEPADTWWLTAKGTSLGGDDGIAVAYALAILDDDNIPHPPLEAVFTVDEEVGMLGATALDASDLKGRILLNIDSEDEGIFTVSCAGGLTAVAKVPCQREVESGTLLSLRLDGFTGGHSGVEIGEGRLNAILTAGRLLHMLKEPDLRLVSMTGGEKDNAIAAFCDIQLLLPETDKALPADGVRSPAQDLRKMSESVLETKDDACTGNSLAECGDECIQNPAVGMTFPAQDPWKILEAVPETSDDTCTESSLSECDDTSSRHPAPADRVRRLEEKIRQEIARLCRIYRGKDDAIQVSLQAEQAASVSCMTAKSTAQLLQMLMNLPNGIQRMSPDVEGLPQTSLNLGILRTEEAGVRLHCSLRSAVEEEKYFLLERLRSYLGLFGGTVMVEGDYPGWAYRPLSRLRDVMTEVYLQQYGREPVVEGIHAGLECGIFCAKLPGLDCISFGPQINEIHTTREALSLASVERTWRLLLETLARLK